MSQRRSTREPSARCWVSSAPASPSSPPCTTTSPSASPASPSRRCRWTRRWCCSAPPRCRGRGRPSRPAAGSASTCSPRSKSTSRRDSDPKNPTSSPESTGTLRNSGSPIIDGSLAYIDCTVASVHDGGDHFVVFGAVAIAVGGAQDQAAAAAVLSRRLHRHRAGQDHAGAVARRPGGVPHHHHPGHLALRLRACFCRECLTSAQCGNALWNARPVGTAFRRRRPVCLAAAGRDP